MLLAGDIGGTKTNLALFNPEEGARAPLKEGTFPSGEYASLEAVLREFLVSVDERIEHACFAVAGPVVAGGANITNLPWVMKEQHLTEALDFTTVHLMNDLAAIAYAVPHLKEADTYTINEGSAVDDGAIAVIAPGTGLGEAFLTCNQGRYSAHASEGGHVDFAPANAVQMELLRYLQESYDHVSYERVCSGIGIPNIYAFFKDTGRFEEPEWLTHRLAAASDPTPVISIAAQDVTQSCAICDATLDTFVEILGAEAGNLALKVLATGGIYLGGGIPPRILALLETGEFMSAFLQKGRFLRLLNSMPVRVILNHKAALLGAAHYVLANAQLDTDANPPTNPVSVTPAQLEDL
ncbi:MAG: glucokinase, partial [Chloroflexota bacterium]|nr:glucokinase [Chloroflexota bacterium]